jgi:hypothetical protein
MLCTLSLSVPIVARIDRRPQRCFCHFQIIDERKSRAVSDQERATGQAAEQCPCCVLHVALHAALLLVAGCAGWGGGAGSFDCIAHAIRRVRPRLRCIRQARSSRTIPLLKCHRRADVHSALLRQRHSVRPHTGSTISERWRCAYMCAHRKRSAGDPLRVAPWKTCVDQDR